MTTNYNVMFTTHASNTNLKFTFKNYSYNKSQQGALFLKFILIKNSTCFRQIYCPSSGISTVYRQQ